jgi:hypothetical protein
LAKLDGGSHLPHDRVATVSLLASSLEGPLPPAIAGGA